MQRAFSTVFLWCLVSLTSAQSVSVISSRLIAPERHNEITALYLAADGTLYFTGSTSVEGGLEIAHDIWAGAMTIDGELKWEGHFGTENYMEHGMAVIPADGGGAWVLGRDVRNHHIWLLRFNEDGMIVSKSPLGRGAGQSGDLLLTPSGDFLVCGAVSTGEDQTAATLWRFDDYGQLLWEKRYAGELRRAADAICVAPGGGYYMFGSATDMEWKVVREWLCQVDADGNVLWEKTVGKEGMMYFPAKMAAIEGGFVTLSEVKAPKGKGRLLVRRYDGVGTMLWEKRFGNGSFTAAEALAVGDDGRIFVGGSDIDKRYLLVLDGDGGLVANKVLGEGSLEAIWPVGGGKVLLGGTLCRELKEGLRYCGDLLLVGE